VLTIYADISRDFSNVNSRLVSFHSRCGSFVTNQSSPQQQALAADQESHLAVSRSKM
jgi:hypothetical protein